MNDSIVCSVGTMNAPSAAMRRAVSGSSIDPCSIERTPASSAISTDGVVWQWAMTYVPQLRATSTATLISAVDSCSESSGSVGLMTPPEAMSLIWEAPRRSCSRAARRTSSTPSTMAKPETRPGMSWS